MKRMKYISMMLASMALSASPLLAQEASAEAPLLSSGTLPSSSSAQAKPSPEFRSYVRLLALNILTDATTNAAVLQIQAEVPSDYMKHSDLFAAIVSKAFNATPRASLAGEEKAFVDEVSQLLPTFYESYKTRDKNDVEAERKVVASYAVGLSFHLRRLLDKYPAVKASLKTLPRSSNFFDMAKLQEVGEKEMEGADGTQTIEESNESMWKMFAKMAEMLRNNEV